MIRVVLPYHLRNIAKVNGDIEIEGDTVTSIWAVVDALESRYPALRGTIRDHTSRKRRPFIRFYVCKEDWSNEPVDRQLPEEVLAGAEPLLIVGAMAGG